MKSYIVKQKDLESRMKSRSGGIFAAISDQVLDQGGVIYGAGLDENFNAVHKRAATKEERDELRGSKYVQSAMGDAYLSACEDLKSGKTVLFTGTPCQIDGMKAVCPKGCEGRLICMDIVCHGVPSPRVWNDYKAYMEQKYRGKIQKVDFRNKKRFGWSDHWETITINGKEHDSQVYMKMFYEHTFLREACYVCPYKNLDRVSDISIADAWGVESANPEFDDNRGVSLVLLNTPKGERWFEQSIKDCDVIECDLTKYMQEPLRKPFAMPDNREQVWKEYNSVSFAELVKRHYKEPLKSVIKRTIRKNIKALIPKKLWERLRGRR